MLGILKQVPLLCRSQELAIGCGVAPLFFELGKRLIQLPLERGDSVDQGFVRVRSVRRVHEICKVEWSWWCEFTPFPDAPSRPYRMPTVNVDVSTYGSYIPLLVLSVRIFLPGRDDQCERRARREEEGAAVSALSMAAVKLSSLLACVSSVHGINVAVANIRAATGADTIHGVVRFEQDDADPLADVTVTVNVTGLSVGEHGFHVHQYGDVRTTSDLSTMSAHFVPNCLPPELNLTSGELVGGCECRFSCRFSCLPCAAAHG